MTGMQGKTVLITGANQGIGKASAIALAKRGANLVLVCRNPEKARIAVSDIEREGGTKVELLVGDMGSQADIRRVASEFKAGHDRLEVLLNNAGVLVPTRRTTVDGIEETFAVNHLGYFLLTNLLLDVLRVTPASRIVNVSSEAHRRAKMNWADLQFKSGSYSTLRGVRPVEAREHSFYARARAPTRGHGRDDELPSSWRDRVRIRPDVRRSHQRARESGPPIHDHF